MFQNITNDDVQAEEVISDEAEQSKSSKVKSLFSIQNIIIYAVSCMVSMVNINSELMPFGLAIFAAACSSSTPAGIVYIACLIGTFIGSGIVGVAEFFITSLIFIAALLIFKPQYRYFNMERNERQKLGMYILAAVVLVQAGKLLFNIFLFYDLLVAIVLSVMVYMFYKIFVNSISVIKDYGKKQAFSIEEVISASLLISIALASLASLKIVGFSVTNIFSVMLVLFLGWRNGVLARWDKWYYSTNGIRNNYKF